MNQHALVFAADSATTVTMWINGERRTRYFKGANKLFQLSAVHPVGLMINGSASLQYVPWELIVKEFRKSLGGDSCRKLAEYAPRFFEFIRNHRGLFSGAARRSAFLDLVDQATSVQMASMFALDAIKNADKSDLTKFQELLLSLLQGRLEELRRTRPSEPITVENVESAVSAHLDVCASETVKRNPALFGTLDAACAPLVAEVAIRALMLEYQRFLSESGVVIGGYGNDDFFPAFEVYDCFGFLDQHFIALRHDSSTAVTAELTAAIEPFATVGMINTFRMGVAWWRRCPFQT